MLNMTVAYMSAMYPSKVHLILDIDEISIDCNQRDYHKTGEYIHGAPNEHKGSKKIKAFS